MTSQISFNISPIPFLSYSFHSPFLYHSLHEISDNTNATLLIDTLSLFFYRHADGDSAKEIIYEAQHRETQLLHQWSQHRSVGVQHAG